MSICFHCGNSLQTGGEVVHYHGTPVKMHKKCRSKFMEEEAENRATARVRERGSYREHIPTPSGLDGHEEEE